MKTNRAMGASAMLMSSKEKSKSQDKLEKERLQLERGNILRRGSWDSSKTGVRRSVVEKRLSLDIKQTILSSTIKAQEELLLGDHDKENLKDSQMKVCSRMFNFNNNKIASLEQSITNSSEISSMDAALSLGEITALTNIEAAQISTLQGYGVSSTALSQLKVENKMLQVSLRKAAKELIGNLGDTAKLTQSINPQLTSQQKNDLKALQVLSLNYLNSMQTLIMASVSGSPEALVDDKGVANSDGIKLGNSMKQQLAGLLSTEMLGGGIARGEILSCIENVSIRDCVRNGNIDMERAEQEASNNFVDLGAPFAGCETAEEVIQKLECIAELETYEGKPLINMKSVLSLIGCSIEDYIQSQGMIGGREDWISSGIEWGSQYTEGESVDLEESTLSDRIVRLHGSGTMALVRVLRAFVDTSTGNADTLTAIMKRPALSSEDTTSQDSPPPSDDSSTVEAQEAGAVAGPSQAGPSFDVSNFTNLVRVGTDLFETPNRESEHNFMTNMPTSGVKKEIFSEENMRKSGELLLQPGLVISLSALEEKKIISKAEKIAIARRFLQEAEEKWRKEELDLLKLHIKDGSEMNLDPQGDHRENARAVMNLFNTQDDNTIQKAFVYSILKQMSSENE